MMVLFWESHMFQSILAGLLLFGISSFAVAQSKLQLKVFTSTPEGFSVTSTLVYGDKDAILIDTQFLQSEAHRLAATILESKKNLTTIYITHPHPDHYFGLTVMKQAFPNARILALPTTVTGIKNGWETRAKFWSTEYGGNLPLIGPILPEELQGNTLMLEGETLEIVGGVVGDAPNNSYVWIPSLKAVVAGDTVFSGVHFGVPKMEEPWLKTLDQIAALTPAVIVPGHQIAGAKNDVSALQFMKNYMRDYDQAVASSKSAQEVQDKVNKKYPHLGLARLLVSGSQAAFPAAR